MLKRATCLRIAMRLALTLLASGAGSAVFVVAGEAGLVRAPAASPGPTLGSIATGAYHGCAVRPDGTLACWGDNIYGQSTPPAGTFTQVAGGAYHTCGVRTGGTLACWGQNTNGQSTPPPGTFTQVAGGSFHTCAVRTDGTLACWGHNIYGQSTPPAGTFTQVTGGLYHTCGLKTDGALACWGTNGLGQSTPPGGSFTQVAAGGSRTCGLKTDGTLACWGDAANGQSVPPAGTFTKIAGGWAHTCGVKTNGTLACWGDNADGQSSPPAGAFTGVAGGTSHTCGLKTDGTLACWGYNGNGASSPPGGTFSRRLEATGGLHTCELQTDGTLACWGDNTYGQSAPPAGTFAEVAGGYVHTCGLTTNGTLSCWGRNNAGQSTPPAGTFTEVAGGYSHGCGLKTDGALACWGDNTYGQSTAPAMHPFTLDALQRGPEGQAHVGKFYESFDQIKALGLDALIISGANVTQPDLAKEPFWGPLIEVIDWAYANVTSTICSCLATHAVLQFRYHQKRKHLGFKRWGVFPHHVVERRHPLVADVNTRFDVPHSRFNDVTRAQFEQAGLRILVESETAGVHLATSADGFRIVFFQGHPEYDTVSLLKEYKREVARYSKGERPDYPPLLDNYFSLKAQAILDEHRERVVAAHAQGKVVPEFPESLISAGLDNTWHDTAEAVIDNWVGKVYQLTNHDRKQPFQPGIDPTDPLGLRRNVSHV